ncbi:hypothetical protein BJ138DRAFT_977553, partial [Hygrophoropsis aurantiaca]
GWEDEMAGLSDEERLRIEKSIRPVKLVLMKLRKLAYKLIHSTTILLLARKEVLEDLELAVRIMPRDVATRWNSIFDMLNFALEYRTAVEEITKKPGLGLRKFELSSHEWKIARQLCDMLKKTLNRYYQLTDASEVYRIAMVLHPRHKLTYFKNAKWESSWIDTAEALVRNEFEQSY